MLDGGANERINLAWGWIYLILIRDLGWSVARGDKALDSDCWGNSQDAIKGIRELLSHGMTLSSTARAAAEVGVLGGSVIVSGDLFSNLGHIVRCPVGISMKQKTNLPCSRYTRPTRDLLRWWWLLQHHWEHLHP